MFKWLLNELKWMFANKEMLLLEEVKSNQEFYCRFFAENEELCTVIRSITTGEIAGSKMIDYRNSLCRHDNSDLRRLLKQATKDILSNDNVAIGEHSIYNDNVAIGEHALHAYIDKHGKEHAQKFGLPIGYANDHSVVGSPANQTNTDEVLRKEHTKADSNTSIGDVAKPDTSKCCIGILDNSNTVICITSNTYADSLNIPEDKRVVLEFQQKTESFNRSKPTERGFVIKEPFNTPGYLEYAFGVQRLPAEPIVEADKNFDQSEIVKYIRKTQNAGNEQIDQMFNSGTNKEVDGQQYNLAIGHLGSTESYPKQIKIPMLYDPISGKIILSIDDTIINNAHKFREKHGKVAFFYNPWTGEKRTPLEIGEDPTGIYIIPTPIKTTSTIPV